ncbi:MAG: hypothetical protein OEW08_05450 [Gammaproteobacteria bacterium]|nr:hypothetical protein [Gammaproteobacteria bacterium]
MSSPNFEILRNMAGFSEAMFNRIVGFQEKDHAAWRADANFAERIRDLPLHALIFSNPDRDPQRHGPTVAHFYPLRDEMYKLGHYLRQLGPRPTVVDAHARNGFIGSLLAREGVPIIGLRDPAAKPNQIVDFFDPDCYEVREVSLTAVDFPVDAVISTWMPSGSDDTPALTRLKPALIVYIYTEHRDPITQARQTGVDDAFGERLPAGYQLVDEWQVQRAENLLHEIWPDLTTCIAETRHVRVYATQAMPKPSVPVDLHIYDWERELRMAEVALQAKSMMKARGFLV